MIAPFTLRQFAVQVSLAIVLMVAGSKLAYSQSRKPYFYITPQVGTMYYVGDLKDNMLPSPRFMRLFYGGQLRYNHQERFEIQVGFFQGKVAGADQWGRKNPLRDFRFRSRIRDFNLIAKYNLWRYKPRLTVGPSRGRIIPGILFGIGYFRFDPEVFGSAGWLNARSLGTEGQNLGGSYPGPYRPWSINVKYGMEFTYAVTRIWSINVFGYYNNTFTDHLDDVSGNYPDLDDLLAGPDGSLVAEYTYRYTNGRIPPGGSRRGNPTLKDGYMNIGVSIGYRFEKKHKVKPFHPKKCYDFKKKR